MPHPRVAESPRKRKRRQKRKAAVGVPPHTEAVCGQPGTRRRVRVGDSPAFQFYADDYLVGTMTMTLAEKGAYMDCLAYQWSVGAVPGDDPKALARVMRCTPAEARKTWMIVSGKFVRGEDGQWRNKRLEKERDKQTAYRESRAVAGRLGGLAKGKHTASTATTVLMTRASDSAVALELAKHSSPFPSPSPSPITPSKDDGVARVVGAAPLVMTSLQRERLLESCRYVGQRLRVPKGLHAEFVTKLAGDDPESRLTAWYGAIDDEVTASRESVADWPKWIRPRFEAWVGESTKAAEWSKWAPGGAFDQAIGGKA